jgi:vancomycin resistance protein YoaR
MIKRTQWNAIVGFAVMLGVGACMCLELGAPGPSSVPLSGYATSLTGRTHSQRFNAVRAASALNGKVILPGAEFSFNKTVKSWSLDRGYEKAPVSYDGELVKAYGGGVCQTSTTLYNAALLAGLEIVERHPHVFAPHYVPPGRDAAVAQYNVDLRLKNPYQWPVTLHTAANEDRLEVRITGLQKPEQEVHIDSEVLSRTEPERLTRVVYVTTHRTGRTFIRNPGSRGYRVCTYRVFYRDGHEVRREMLGDDTYESMNRIVQMTESEEARL